MNSSTAQAINGVSGAAAVVILGVAKAFKLDIDPTTAVAAVTLLGSAVHFVMRYLPAPKQA